MFEHVAHAIVSLRGSAVNNPLVLVLSHLAVALISIWVTLYLTRKQEKVWTKYTLFRDEKAVQAVERLKQTYGLPTEASVYELAAQVLAWTAEQQASGHPVGRRSNEGVFEPLILPEIRQVN